MIYKFLKEEPVGKHCMTSQCRHCIDHFATKRMHWTVNDNQHAILLCDSCAKELREEIRKTNTPEGISKCQ